MMISLFSRRWHVGAVAAVLAVVKLAHAAPYPPDGLPTQWTQPDGTVLSLRVHGDEFYGRTTTEDGFTVLYNDADKTYYYAIQGEDAKSLVRSNVPADKPAPLSKRQLRESSEQISAVRNANIQEYAPERIEQGRKRDGQPVPVLGNKVGLTILVQFPDVNFPVSRQKIERLCNEVGYNDDGNSGSIRDYFSDQSLGALTHTQTVTAIVTVPQPRNYYNFSDYPTNLTLRDAGAAGRLLLRHAITAVNAAGLDTSSLTVDGSSNRVVATSLLFAGANSGVWAKGLWPHAWNLDTGGSLGGKTVYRYQCTNIENSSPVIGTIIHELGHLLLGYPDLYDTDASDGNSEGVGEHCLMGSANYLNGGRTPAPINLYLKSVSGWANITDFTETQSLNISLPSTGNIGYRLRKPGSTTEYFLIENRGAGDKWANYCKDKGIAIWHIDEAVTTDNQRQQMTSQNHYLVSIQQADGRFDLERDVNRGDSGDLYDNTSSEFDDFNNPDSKWWNGAESGLYLKVQSPAGASMNVQLGLADGVTRLGLTPGNVIIPSNSSTQTFSVNSNAEWTWIGKPSWMVCNENTPQSGRQIFEYSVSSNFSTTARTANLVFTAGEITRTYTVTQLGMTNDDHGNNRSLATLVGLNSVTAGDIEKAGDVDFFRLDVNGPGFLTLRTTGSTDTVGTLYSDTGAQLAENDDSGGINFRIERDMPQSATLYLRVKNYEPSVTGQYELISNFVPSGVFAITPEFHEFPVSGGEASFNVQTTSDRPWQVSGVDAPGVTGLPGGQYTGNRTITYRVPANTGAKRVMKITAGSVETSSYHTIIQAGVPRADLTGGEESAVISPQVLTPTGKVRIQTVIRNTGTVNAGTFTIQFVAGSTPTFNTTYGEALGSLTVAGLEAGGVLPIDFIGSLSANVAPNRSADWWVAWVIDSGNAVLEENETNNKYYSSQLGCAASTLAVTPGTRSIEGHLVTDSVAATCNTSWTWSANVPWISSIVPSMQVGDQTFSYQALANPNTTARTGTITFVSGSVSRTHVITQGPKPIPLEFTSFQRSGNDIQMGFRSEIGKKYRVTTSTDLQPGSWQPVTGHTGITGNGSPISRTLPGMGIPATDGRRFFRVEKE